MQKGGRILRKKTMLAISLFLLAALSSPVASALMSMSATSDLTITSFSSSTNVSGRISTNTTWTLANSPYIVVDDLVVETDVFLTIEPGVVVKFTNEKNLVIDGALVAQGNSTHQITFTSNSTAPDPGDWGTIRFRDTSTDEACIIDWTIIEYANAGITIYNSSPKISNSIIRHNDVGFQSDYDNYYGNARIFDTLIHNNTRGVAGYFYSYYTSPSTLTRSIISNNTYGVESSGLLVIQESTISYNTYGIWSDQVKILGSNITDNTHGIGAYSATISKSIIADNDGMGISPKWWYDYNTTYYDDGSFSIKYSTITGNKENGIVSKGYGINSIHFSNIYGNTPYDVSNLAPYERNADVNATDNWWGTTNTAEIDEHLYDYYDDYNLRRVIYEPYLDSLVTIPPIAHDVAITNVTASPTSVDQGSSVYITVTVVNEGDFDENVTVTPRYDSVQIGNWTWDMYGSLPAGQSATAYFYWYTWSVPSGDYVISAEVNIVPGETDTTDNVFIDGIVTVIGPPPVHDVAITWVSASPTSVEQGEPVTITVSAGNEGSFTETFNVTTYYDSTVIETKNVADLAPGTSTDLIFTWNTSGVAGGYYVITAEASVVPGENETWDNSYSYWEVFVIGPQRPYAYFYYNPSYPLAGEPVTFDASSSYDPDGYIVDYFWNFGDGTTGTGITITHVYTAGGAYNVTLRVTDNDGLNATSSHYVEVSAPSIVHDIMVAYMSAGPMDVFAGETVYVFFEVYNQGTESEIFDVSVYADEDATIIGDEIIIGSFTEVSLGPWESRGFDVAWYTTGVQPGYYTLSVEVPPVLNETDTANNILVGGIVSVALPPPVAYVSWQPNAPYVGDTVVFNASSSYDPDGYIVSYYWSFGDGTTTNTTDPITEHIYAQPHTYTVTLTVTDNDGLTSTTTEHITVIHRVLCIELSGEFDYLRMEPVNIRLAAIVTDAQTMEPVSSAEVNIEIYDPAGNLWLSAQMQEEISGSGIYEWTSAGTIGQLRLSKGVYLVRGNASSRGGPVAHDILLFHIDPPTEGTSEILYYLAFAVIALAGATGIVLRKRHIVNKHR